MNDPVELRLADLERQIKILREYLKFDSVWIPWPERAPQLFADPKDRKGRGR